MHIEVRYRVIDEPFGRFVVWDEHVGAPVEIGDCVLIGLQKEDATLLAAMLNNGHQPSVVYLKTITSLRP